MNLPVRAPAWGGGGLVVPPEFAGVTTLGSAEQVYGPKQGANVGLIVVMCLGIGFLALGIVIAVFAVPPASIVFFFLGALLGGIGVYNILRLRGGARALVIYPNGFAALVRSEVSVWPWSDIAVTVTKDKMITGKRSVYHERRLDVSKPTGETVILLGEHFEDIRAIVARIKNTVNARLLPPLQQAYESGQSVPFGPVTASKTAIESDGRRLAWADVANVVVKDGRLVVTPRSGKPMKVRTSKIPNIELLGALIGVSPSKMDLEYY